LDIYQVGLRPLLFSVLKADAEWVHNRSLQILELADRTQSNPATSRILDQFQQSFGLQDSRLEQSLWGLNFKNPVGLAAGFDKNGVAAGIWTKFGFGFAELGTVTWHPQPGNPQPRLFRLTQDSAALNRMGFNNQGAIAMAARFQAAHNRGKLDNSYPTADSPFPLGINLGKSKVTPLEQASTDYLESFKLLQDWGDYFVVNVSSPNTPGLRSLQDAAQLSTILDIVQQKNQGIKPILGFGVGGDRLHPRLSNNLPASRNYRHKHHHPARRIENTNITRNRQTNQRRSRRH
jgi:dihydroorotate dehydrogenase